MNVSDGAERTPNGPRSGDLKHVQNSPKLRGWEQSATAWIAAMGDQGDEHRRFILDRPMLQLTTEIPSSAALDVGCGEGRFCRLLRQRGVKAVGLDSSPTLLKEARHRDPNGEYVLGRVESLPFAEARFDVVIAYLSLVDFADLRAAIREIARVLAPGGRFLIANLNSQATAGFEVGWLDDQMPQAAYRVSDYFTETRMWVSWRGITVENWHRPLATYMTELETVGLRLTRFLEPVPHGGAPDRVASYLRSPAFLIMEWAKPA